VRERATCAAPAEHYRIRLEPSGDGGDEAARLHVGAQEVAIRGRRLHDFLEHVVPLLDGRSTRAQIDETTAEIFDAADLDRTLALLAAERLVVDTALGAHLGEDAQRFGPQLSYLHEVGADPFSVREATGRRAGLGGRGRGVSELLAATAHCRRRRWAHSLRRRLQRQPPRIRISASCSSCRTSARFAQT